MNNENKPSVIAELTAALASMAERAAAAEAEAEQYKKSSGEWYQFFTSKDKELRDTQAELQKARKRCSFDCCRISESWPGQSHQNCEGRKAPVPYRTH